MDLWLKELLICPRFILSLLLLSPAKPWNSSLASLAYFHLTNIMIGYSMTKEDTLKFVYEFLSKSYASFPILQFALDPQVMMYYVKMTQATLNRKY